MGSGPSVPGGRPTVVAVRLSREEEAALDAERGSLSRSEWLRWQIVQARRRREAARPIAAR